MSSAVRTTSLVRQRALQARLLPHTCAVSRAVASDADDAWGDGVAADPDVETGVPCLAWDMAGRREQITATNVAAVGDWRFKFPHGTALSVADSISDVRDAAGALMVAGPLNVTDVQANQRYVLAVTTEAT